MRLVHYYERQYWLQQSHGETPYPLGDRDGTAARDTARLDHNVCSEHGDGAERIDGAHGMHNSAAKPDAVFGRSAGQRIGANDGVAVAVADHEIAGRQPVQQRRYTALVEPGPSRNPGRIWPVIQPRPTFDDRLSHAIFLIPVTPPPLGRSEERRVAKEGVRQG